VKWLIFFIVVGLLSCKPAKKAVTVGEESVTIQKQPIVLVNPIANNEESDKKDSVQLKTMLTDMLSIAHKLRSANAYHKKINQWSYIYATTGDIKFGHIFDHSKKHLIITRNMGTWLTYIDVFMLNRSKFHLILSSVKSDMTMIADTTRDINGDHFKDFVVHWYPSSGCCRRNIYDVYLYQKNSGNFTPKYEFINPTFSPSEKVIRGVEYSQPGEGPLYKYKWNGLRVDTVTFIYPRDTLSTGLPKEFRKIEDIDWFTDQSIGELPKIRKTKVG
jgi:hypothetical protein